MGKVNIDTEFVEEAEEMLMKLIDSYENITKKLGSIENGISQSFDGNVGIAYKAYVTTIKKKMSTNIGDFINKNYNDIKVLKEEFQKIDNAYTSLNSSSFDTSDFKIGAENNQMTISGGQTQAILSGSSYKRK
ncbi:hypothetical protein [Isobaculum melis]|uniref:LXG domain of WXG superfamily protein n=1 Tax=Isobaculum melis TaxID=142588 RepID=A0A1H9UJ75_9LACT|nr:hypothetical protein [Isobaculum melis]SES09412.1 hypothetical protein SAMN04488559_1335 [Isobaculum melis]